MIVYIVFETEDIEPISIRTFSNLEKATDVFEACAHENGVCENDVQDRDLEGTLKIAGDDVYCVQLVSREVDA